MGWLLLAALFTLPGALGSNQAPDRAGAVLPPVRPVAVWLAAVKDADQEQLKTAFSEAMRRQFDRDGWDTAMRTYQEIFKKEFGDYRLEDFSFEFTGDENRGTVSIAYKGRTLPALRVINEKNEWKIDER